MNPASGNSEWRAGWRVLLVAALGCGAGIGTFFMTAGAFLGPMQQDLGGSRAALSIAPAVYLVGSLLQPLGGYVIDRFGAARVAPLGLLALAAIYAVLALSPPEMSRGLLYPCAAALAVLNTVTNYVVYCRAVATWFERNAGLAFSITIGGAPLISAFAVPALASLMDEHGWRAGYLVLAVFAGVVAAPVVAVWLRERPRAAVEASRRAPPVLQVIGAAVRRKVFWVLVAAFAVVSLPVGGIMYNLFAILTSRELSSAEAAAAVSAFTLSIAVERVIGGYLLDRFSPQYVAAMLFAVPSLGVVLLLYTVDGSTPWIVLALAGFLLGWAQGTEGDCIVFFARRVFGVEAFGSIVAAFSLVIGPTIAAGGILYSIAYDAFGNYDLVLMASAALFVAGGLLMSRLELPPPEMSTLKES